MSSNIEVTYEELKAATQNKTVLIIDVRNATELAETGVIPNSINIPLPDVENVLKNYDQNQFQSAYGRDKPHFEAPIIFSCRSGKRSLAALGTAQALGYKNAKHYPEGWLGWQRHQNEENH